ncbi:hypothetical protein tb265_39640 [Gemmatimonadetes bacterium T265]|nr:hypothetical protein tb265_39640 [Gemmatimonadetes bacterium T265]
MLATRQAAAIDTPAGPTRRRANGDRAAAGTHSIVRRRHARLNTTENEDGAAHPKLNTPSPVYVARHTSTSPGVTLGGAAGSACLLLAPAFPALRPAAPGVLYAAAPAGVRSAVARVRRAPVVWPL